MWTPRNTYCIFEQEIMFWTSLHMSVGRNSQYTCVYVSKSGIRLVIFLAYLLSWHRLQALMFENSHHKLTSNFSLPYPFHVPEDAWGRATKYATYDRRWQQLAPLSNCAILILLSFSFSMLHAGVLWPSLLSFTLRSPHRAVLMFKLLSLWRMRLSSSFSVVLLSSEHYKATQRWHLCWIF